MDHPITPPPELVEQWYNECPEANEASLPYVAAQAAQWGADQELKACYEWVVRDWTDIQSADRLLAARRPKPPSLKEQAFDALHGIHDQGPTPEQVAIIRRALEALDD